MQKTIEQLQAELDREIAYSMSLNKKIDRMREQLKNSITKEEHEKITTRIRQEYEQKLSIINLTPPKIYNERGAGRKKIATNQVITMALELRAQGLSQAKIADKLTQKLGIKIGRTTVGEIVRGKYVSSGEE